MFRRSLSHWFFRSCLPLGSQAIVVAWENSELLHAVMFGIPGWRELGARGVVRDSPTNLRPHKLTQPAFKLTRPWCDAVARIRPAILPRTAPELSTWLINKRQKYIQSICGWCQCLHGWAFRTARQSRHARVNARDGSKFVHVYVGARLGRFTDEHFHHADGE